MSNIQNNTQRPIVKHLAREISENELQRVSGGKYNPKTVVIVGYPVETEASFLGPVVTADAIIHTGIGGAS